MNTVPERSCAGTSRDEDRNFARTLARGLEILMCFATGEATLGNRDFALRTGLGKATVARLTFTLTELGYLRRDPASARYRLGSQVLSIGYPLLASMHVRQIARPLMKALADQVGGNVSIGLRDRGHMVYVDTSQPSQVATPFTDIGASVPLIDSAMGLAWLARCAAAERARVLNQLMVSNPDGFERQRTRVDQAVREFASRGLCSYTDPQRRETSIAAPITRPIDSQIVVIDCVVFSRGRPPGNARLDEIGKRLLMLVQSVEVGLGLH